MGRQSSGVSTGSRAFVVCMGYIVRQICRFVSEEAGANWVSSFGTLFARQECRKLTGSIPMAADHVLTLLPAHTGVYSTSPRLPR